MTGVGVTQDPAAILFSKEGLARWVGVLTLFGFCSSFGGWCCVLNIKCLMRCVFIYPPVCFQPLERTCRKRHIPDHPRTKQTQTQTLARERGRERERQRQGERVGLSMVAPSITHHYKALRCPGQDLHLHPLFWGLHSSFHGSTSGEHSLQAGIAPGRPPGWTFPRGATGATAQAAVGARSRKCVPGGSGLAEAAAPRIFSETCGGMGGSGVMS